MKKSFLLCLLMTLFTTWAVQAAELTVNDGTSTISQVPIHGYYSDYGTRSQFVVPAENLEEMVNGTISAMTFYSSTAAESLTGTWEVYLKEVDETSATATFISRDDATLVWTGSPSIADNVMKIEFSEDFAYSNQGLMIEFVETEVGNCPSISWYGVSGTSAYKNGTSSDHTSHINAATGTAIQYVPKVTFTYTPGEAPACPKASGITFTDVTATSATMSWDAISNVSMWNFMASTESDFPDDTEKTFSYSNIPAMLVSSNTIDFTTIQSLTGFSLQPNTTYYVKLQANCGTDGLGDWSNVKSFRTLCSALALPFFDGFEENNLANECWTSESVSGTSSWTTGEGDYSTSTGTGNGLHNALIKHGSNGNVTRLISPVIDMSSVPAAELSFMHIQRPWGNDQDVLKVYYRTSAADEWHLLQEYTEAINSWTTEENISLPNISSTYQIAFEMTDSYGYGVAIDDVRIAEPPACAKPTSLAVSNITAHNATFSWTGESDNGWQLCLNDGGDDEFYNVSANPFTFASAPLKAETEYTAKLRTLCEGDATSDWSNEVTFTTDIACPAPTFDVEAISNMGATEAAIAWEGDAENYTLSYRKARYVDGVEENFKTTPSGWTQYTGLYNEEEGTATLTTTTYAWSFGTGNGVFDSHERVNIYGNNQRWLVTPQFICEGSNMDFDIALTAYTGTDVPAPQLTGTDDKFMVLVSADNMQTWKVLRKWDNAGSEYVYNEIANTATGESVTLDLGDYVGQSIHVAFYGESTENNADNNLHIDNVLIGTVHEPTAWISESGITEKSKQITGLEPETKYDVKVQSNCGSDGMSEESEIISFTTTATCVVPANLTASDITAHTATFDWESNGDAWQLSLSCSAGETVFNVDALPYSVETLDAETSYTVKVRTVCGEDYSDWSSTITFTTDVACPAPTNLEVELTPGDGKVASLLWAAGSAENWILQYSESAAFEPAQEITVNGNSFYDLDDLTPETTYFARVKAVCGGIDGESAWSEPISFKPTNAYSLTINDGTTTNTEVPVYGSWTDAHSNSQFIIPASTLEEIQYAQLTQLTFYANNTNISWGAAQFEVYVLEVNETTISSLYAWDDLEKVMTAANLSIVNGQMVVTFDAPYQYMGGNLLIGIYQPTSGTYTGCSWYGISATGAALGGYTSNSGSLSVSAQNFLPKMTINYIPGEAPSCPKPTGLTIEYNGGTEAIVSWTSDAESWNLEYGNALININQNPYTIQNLVLATTYQVRVQALCSEENASDWTNVVEFTTDLCLPEEMKTITYKLTDSYNDGWNGSAALRVVHKTTNTEIASLTLAAEDSPLEGSLDLCCGEEYSFIWKKGQYDTECGFEIYDINGDIILSKEGCNTGCESPDDGVVLLNYTMNCSSGPTGVEDVKNDAQVYKFVKDGNLFILHNGKLFNAQGKFVK